MSYSNRDWLNQIKSTNLNINEINTRMINTLENLERENINLKKALNELDLDNQEKNKTIENSHKIITKLNEEYNKNLKECQDIEKYATDLEKENKMYKNLLDDITKSHDIHKTLILQNENLKNKILKKKNKIADLKSNIKKNELEIKENRKEINDKNNIIDDFNSKFEEFEKLLETKEMLLNTAELSNNELKSKIKSVEKDNKDLLKRLNDELLNKKLDFEEIIKQSIEALKVFYAKFENNINNNQTNNAYFEIKDNLNSTEIYKPECLFSQNDYSNTNNLEANTRATIISRGKNSKIGFNTVGYNEDEIELKSINSKIDRINRSLSPLGYRENNSFSKTFNKSKEKFNRARFEKRSKSVVNRKDKLNLTNLKFLHNDIFNFKDYFTKLNNEISNKKIYINSENDLNFKKTLTNNFDSSSNNPKEFQNNEKNNLYAELNNPLKIIIEQAIINPINYKIDQKKIIRGNLQAFNFYYNFLKSEVFSSLLRENYLAVFIKDKLTPILKDYADENSQNPKSLRNNIRNLHKNLLNSMTNQVNDLKNALQNEVDLKNKLIQEIKNMQIEKEKLHNQLEEVEGNLGNLNNLFNKNINKLFEKVQIYKTSKENAERKIESMSEDLKVLNNKNHKLLDNMNDLQQKYSNSIAEYEELNRELIDLKKRIQQRNDNNYSGNYITTEENFSFKGNNRDIENTNYNNLNQGLSRNDKNKEINLMKENLYLKDQADNLNFEKKNLTVQIQTLQEKLDIELEKQHKYSRVKFFERNCLFVRRASEVYYFSNFFGRNTTNTFEYTNNSNNNIFTSLDYNNLLLRDDENNRKIYTLEIEKEKLNLQIGNLLNTNQEIEFKLRNLKNKLGKFDSRGLSMHNNIRLNIETSEEFLFKRSLIEKNEEVTLKYNVPTINYTNENHQDEIVCSTCKAQYQEVKALRKAIRTNTYKELKAFYMNLNVDLNKISSKFDNILENFNKTYTFFDIENDVSNSGSSNFTLNKTIKHTQIKDILQTFAKMIGVLSNTIKKYQKDINTHSNNLDKLFEFVYRIVFSTLIFNEKVRSKIRESKSQASISENKDETFLKKKGYNQNYLVKFENYMDAFKAIQLSLIDKENILEMSNESSKIKNKFSNVNVNNLADVFRKYMGDILNFIENESNLRGNIHQISEKNIQNNTYNFNYNSTNNKKEEAQNLENKNETIRNNRFISLQESERSEKSSKGKLNAIDNITLGNYNYDYSARNTKQNYNNIPLNKSRSHSNNSINESNKLNSNNKISLENEKDKIFDAFSLILKHYFAAKDVLLNYVSEDIRNNLSINKSENFDNLRNASEILKNIFNILDDISSRLISADNEMNKTTSQIINLILSLVSALKNTLIDIFD